MGSTVFCLESVSIFNMTKIVEWLSGAALFAAVWAVLVSKYQSTKIDTDCVRHLVLLLYLFDYCVESVYVQHVRRGGQRAAAGDQRGARRSEEEGTGDGMRTVVFLFE